MWGRQQFWWRHDVRRAEDLVEHGAQGVAVRAAPAAGKLLVGEGEMADAQGELDMQLYPIGMFDHHAEEVIAENGRFAVESFDSQSGGDSTTARHSRGGIVILSGSRGGSFSGRCTAFQYIMWQMGGGGGEVTRGGCTGFQYRVGDFVRRKGLRCTVFQYSNVIETGGYIGRDRDGIDGGGAGRDAGGTDQPAGAGSGKDAGANAGAGKAKGLLEFAVAATEGDNSRAVRPGDGRAGTGDISNDKESRARQGDSGLMYPGQNWIRHETPL